MFGAMSSETFPNWRYFQSNTCNHSLWFVITIYNTARYIIQRELKQMEPILNFQVPAEGLELVILLHTQYITLIWLYLPSEIDKKYIFFTA